MALRFTEQEQDSRYAPPYLTHVDSAALKWEPEPPPARRPEAAVAIVAAPAVAPRCAAGVALAMLGDGPDGLHRAVRQVCTLEIDEALDIVGADPRCPTTFVAESTGVRLDVIGAIDGVFVRIKGPVPLRHGDCFRLGITKLRFEATRTSPGCAAWGALVRLREDGWPTERYEVSGLGTTIGRSRGDVVLSHDPFLSHRHCRVVADSTGVYLDDLNSDNGTYREAREGELLPFGAIVRIGESTLRVDPGAE